MRGLSTNALIQFRKHAKKNNDLDISILKIRLNCMIDACEHITTTLNGKVYQFGACKITVNGCNVIRNIEWNPEPILATKREVAKMKQLFLANGLDANGTKFLNKK